LTLACKVVAQLIQHTARELESQGALRLGRREPNGNARRASVGVSSSSSRQIRRNTQ
jgi:hypothetical protein